MGILGDNNTIGGTTSGTANTIAFNGKDGVFVAAGATGNAIKGNSIFENTGLGIDLNPDGVATNDTGDGDGGANLLQNYPVLTSASLTASTSIGGSLNSVASQTYRVEFFESTSCDASTKGEGKTFLGFSNVTTDGTGNVTFTSVILREFT